MHKNFLDVAEQCMEEARVCDNDKIVHKVASAVDAILAYFREQAKPPVFTIPPTKDCGVHDLVKKMQVSETPDFCWSCGANKPPIIGEGTCPACDPFGFLQNPQLSDTDKLVALVAEAKRRGFIIGPLGTSTGAPGPIGASGAQGCCGSIPCTLAHSCPFDHGDDPGPSGAMGEPGEGPVADFRPRGEVAMEVLRTLNGIRKLGDYTYDIREREGLGWDGPQTKAWSDACAKAERLLSQ